jgi:site-specific DNA-methyltransferase (adenine-specific)/modification methylase
VAKKLEEEKKLPEDRRRYWNFTSVAEAFRLGILAEKEDEQNQLLAKAETFRTSTSVQRNSDQELIKHVEEVTSKPDALAFERERYNSNPLNTIPFEKYWEEKVRLAEEAKNTIYLSNRFIHCDCITFMNDPDRVGVYDHIITDPPYAIDMDNLQQQNQNGGMNLPGVVEDAHQVEENIQLLKNFFPAAFKCTKDKAYVVVFCDLMMWQFLYDQATAAGFSVQRWPVIWRKVGQSVMNNCAQVNTAKDYEPILICHKPGATLATRSNTSFIDGSNVEAKKVTGHPFAKPFEVTKALVQMVSGEGQTILEPFAGGGSIVLEMLRQKRNVIALNKHEDEYNRMLENVKREYYLKLNPKYVFK